MDRKEFLKELREYLECDLPEFEIVSHITYYDEYFDQRILDGATEEEVLEELGNPRLIAKTLIDTSNMSSNRNTKHFDYDYSQEYEENEFDKEKIKNKTVKEKFKEWLVDVFFGRKEIKTIHKVLAILIAVLLVGVVLAVVLFLMNFILAILPIVLVLWLVYAIINDKRNK